MLTVPNGHAIRMSRYCIMLVVVFCITEQFEAMQDELSRRREECIQLRTILASQGKRRGDIANESYQGDPFAINEDGELQMAYRTQKDLNKYVFFQYCF